MKPKKISAGTFLLSSSLLTVGCLSAQITVGPSGDHTTIQAAVDAAAPGETISVAPGTYQGPVVIPGSKDGIKLLSTGGRAVTTITGIPNSDTIRIESGADGVQIGDTSQGFTIVGMDEVNPGFERAAVYFVGNNAGSKVIGNEIVAGGEVGLLTEYGGIVSDFTISGNLFSGFTYDPNLPVPSTGNQFTTPNWPRIVVYVGNAPTKSDIVFSDNVVTASSGNTDNGNISVNIDANGVIASGNTFSGSTGSRPGVSTLRLRGSNSDATDNVFSGSGSVSLQLGDGSNNTAATSTATGNSFLGTYTAALVNGGSSPLDASNNYWGSPSGPSANQVVGNAVTFPYFTDGSLTQMDAPVKNITDPGDIGYFGSIQAAYSAASPDDVIELQARTFTEGELNIAKAVTIKGPNAGKSGTAPNRTAEARISNSKWIITAAGVTIDGVEIHQTNDTADAVLVQATATVSNSVIRREGISTGTVARGITSSPGVTSLLISGNLFTGDPSGSVFSGHKTWQSGIYSNGGSATITGNTFEICRGALNLDDFNANIEVSANTFRSCGTYISFGGTVPTDGQFEISGNEFGYNFALLPAQNPTLLNNSNVAETFRIDATSSTFGGIATSDLTTAQKLAIEERMSHRGRGNRKGVIDYVAGQQIVVQGTTIAGAISAASAGDTVLVGPGTFTETLVINKGGLKLLGANAGKSYADATRTAESVISGTGTSPGLVTVSAANVTVDGFSLQMTPPTPVTNFTFGFRVQDSGAIIENNIITGTGNPSVKGYGFQISRLNNTTSPLVDGVIVRDNKISGFDRQVSGEAHGINVGGSLDATNTLIERNLITGNFNGIYVDRAPTGTIIRENIIDQNPRFGIIDAQGTGGNGGSTQIVDNIISANGSFGGATSGGIQLYGSNANVSGNTLSGSTGADVLVRTGFDSYNPAPTLAGNSFAPPLAGSFAVVNSSAGTVNAESNYWGRPEGPLNPETLQSTSVDFDPWFAASNGATPPVLTVPRTGIFDPVVINTPQANVPDLYIAPGNQVTVTPAGSLDVTALELAAGASLVVNGGSLKIGEGSTISGTFTIFNSFGSWNINGDTTFNVGKSLALISDIHVAAGTDLTVNGGGELILDGSVIDSQTAGSPYNINVENDGLLTIARSVVTDAVIDINTISPVAKSRVYDSSFTNSDIEASVDSRVYHNLFDAATLAASNGDVTSAFDSIDGWSNVTDAAQIQNRFSIGYDAPSNSTRTLDADGNLFVQPSDPVVMTLQVSDLGARTITAAEALLGYNSGLLSLMPAANAVQPLANWDVIAETSAITSFGMIDSALGVEFGTATDGIGGDNEIAKVNFTALAPGATIGFFRVQTDGNYDGNGNFIKDTRLTQSSGGVPSFLTAFTSNTGELIIDNEVPVISTVGITGTQTQPTTGSVNILLPTANRVLREGNPVTLTFTASDFGLAGLDAADATADLTLTETSSNTVLAPGTNYTVSATETGGVVTYTVILDVPVTSPAGTYTIAGSVIDRSGNPSAATTLGSFQIANEVIATVEHEGFLLTGAGFRDVTFVATGGVAKQWVKSVSFTNGTGSIALEDVPAGTTAISAKTAWTLRSKKPAVFSLAGVSAVSFSGTDKLRAGDINGDNVINTLDYSILRNNWLTTSPIADLTGNGAVNSDDYNILQANFYTAGSAQ